MIQSPHKHTRLSTLKEIKTNYYVGKDGTEYCAEEVDQMIVEKEMKKAEDLCNQAPDRYFKKREAERLEWENEQI